MLTTQKQICFNFNAQTTRWHSRWASARHLRTAHELAADSSGASHRLAPVLDPDQLDCFGSDSFCNQTLRPAIRFILNVIHRPDDFIASSQPWCGCFREFCRVIEFRKSFQSRSRQCFGKLLRVTAAAGRTLGHVIQSSVHWDYAAAKSKSFRFFACFFVLKKGYKTNIPSFLFERIVEITYLRRDWHITIFPRGFAPR